MPARLLYSGAARNALGELQTALAGLPDPDIALRTLSPREAVRSGQIEGAQVQIADLFVFEAIQAGLGLAEGPAGGLVYTLALKKGLPHVRKRGVQAFDVELIQSL